MDKKTEEAIQEIGKMAKNVNDAPGEFVKGMYIFLGVFLIFAAFLVFVLPVIQPWIQCEVFNDPFCGVPTVASAPQQQYPDGIYCDLNSQGGVHKQIFFHFGWQDLKSYLEIYPNTKVLGCD